MRRMSIVNILILAILFSSPIVVYLHALGVIGNKDVFPWMLHLVPAVFLALFAEFALYKLAAYALSSRGHSPLLTLGLGFVGQAICFGGMMALRHHSHVHAILYNSYYLAITALLIGFFSFFVLILVQRLSFFTGMNLQSVNLRGRYVLVFVACLSALLMLGTRLGSPSAGGRGDGDSHKNVVLITIDCLRFDALGCTGGVTQTPNIDGLYDEGVFFNNYCSHAPYTHPALTSIMTSLEVPLHKIRRQVYQLDESFVTLPEVLTDNGYTCYCPGDLLIDMWGLGQGFGRLGRFSDAAARWLFSIATVMARVYPGYFGEFCFGENSSMWSTVKALEFLRRNGSKDFFLWIHYFNEPHSPYCAPPSYRKLYNDDATSWVTGSNEELYALNGHPVLAKKVLDGHTLTADDLLFLTNLYRAEVSACDTEVGMILGALKRYGLLDDTMIVLTADHGEDFSEKGHFAHSNNLYSTLLHVPLIVKLPSENKHETVSSFVMGKDIAPTILNYSGIEMPDQFRGVSMFPLGRTARGGGDRWCYSETTSFGYGWPYNKFGFSYTSTKYKYICAPQEDMEELYDLEADPNQTVNIVESRSEVRDRIRSEILELFGMSDIDELIPKVGPRGMKYQRDRLRALGYIE
jgi:arylsulfatase A-like enzyme